MRCAGGPFEKANAEALKDQGNAKFQAHAYREAIQLYSKAISAAPGVASYYGNRGGGAIRLSTTTPPPPRVTPIDSPPNSPP